MEEHNYLYQETYQSVNHSIKFVFWMYLFMVRSFHG